MISGKDPLRPLSVPYLAWAKNRPSAEFSLARSGLEDRVGRTDASARAALGKVVGISLEHLVLTPGATGANTLAFAALGEPGTGLASEEPTYSPALDLARALGLAIHPFPRPGPQKAPNIADVERAVRVSRLVWLTDPHNPTGATLDASFYQELAGLLKERDAFAIVDEVYRPFVRGEPAFFDPAGRIVLTGSLTKAYGLGPLRAGYAAVPPALMERFATASDVLWGLPPHVPLGLLRRGAAINLALLRRRLKSRLDLAARILRLDRRGLPEVAPFFALEVPDGDAFARRALERGVLVVPGSFFGALGLVRVSVLEGERTLRRAFSILRQLRDE